MDRDLDLDRELELPDKSNGYYSGTELYNMNAKFIAAMSAAVRAGCEHPPRVGVDQTPGTKNPTCYAVRGGEVRQSQGPL
jgi:hypothetical protein